MQVLRHIEEARHTISALRMQYSIALVPTMGGIHQGHLSLVELAKEYADKVIVSIFVNPLQFNNTEDLENYPRTEETDLAYLEAGVVEAVFLPTEDELYPKLPELKGDSDMISAGRLANELCGKYCAGHFDGVLTVVNKLFDICMPDFAIFGKKDYQQYVLIKDFVRTNYPDLQIIMSETVRDSKGFALSSRNNYLTEEERERAPMLYQILKQILDGLQGQGVDSTVYTDICERAKQNLTHAGFKPEYVEIRDAETLYIPDKDSTEQVILAAAWLGKARLIDNIIF